MSQSPSSPRSPRAKSTLFCPDCGHESHAAGDWSVRTSAERVAIHCPSCGARVDERPRTVEKPAPEASTESTTLFGSLLGPVAASVAVQRRVVDWWKAQGDRLTSFATV
ncbi:hypothetical protein [Salinigranum sp. GCM10025319]|uniref:hypothetical protein n=1 Tax=Salinigranum sp. GCM10025319 TaxID=3252687 RepID=UPI00360A6618